MENPVVRHSDVLGVVDATTGTLAGDWRNTDGGWGKEIGPAPTSERRESDAWTTAGVAIWLTTFDAAQYHQHIEVALRKLRDWQRRPDMVQDGGGDWGWGLLPGRASGSNSTALALFAHTNYFRRRGLPVRDEYREGLQHAGDWLMDAMIGQAGMPGKPGKEISLAFNTCWSVLALADCLALDGLDDATIRNPVLQALEYVMSPRARRLGGWGRVLGQDPDVIGTAYCMYLLQRLLPERLLDKGQTTQILDAVGGVIRGFYNPDGSWKVPGGYSPIEGTSWAIIALLATGEPADSPFIQQSIHYLVGFLRRQEGPRVGWPQFPGEPSACIWMTCYACYALWMYGHAIRELEQKQEEQAKSSPTPIEVFISHGHTTLYQQAESLLTSMNPSLKPIVMKEEPAEGMEGNMHKLERLAKHAQYAIIIDDDQRPNVLHELGYFMNKLPLDHIWLLLKQGVEPPSNIGGHGYITIDESGNWMVDLIKGLRVAGLIP